MAEPVAIANTPPAPEVLAKLITDNLGLIYTFAIRMNYMHRDEIVQQACLGIMRSKTYDPSISVATFLHWQVRGAFTHLKNRESRFNKAKSHADPAIFEEPIQEGATDLASVLRKVPTLPERQRRAVTLLIAGNNATEIGRAMGVSRQAANELVSRAADAMTTGRIRGWGHGLRANENSKRR